MDSPSKRLIAISAIGAAFAGGRGVGKSIIDVIEKDGPKPALDYQSIGGKSYAKHIGNNRKQTSRTERVNKRKASKLARKRNR